MPRYHQRPDRRRNPWGRNARLERAVTAAVIALVVVTLVVFLVVYHDVPLRVP